LMPRYVDVSGERLEEYSPDGLSSVIVVRDGARLVYVLKPPALSEEEGEELEEILNQIPLAVPAREILDEAALRRRLEELGVGEKLLYHVMARIHGYDWLEPLMRDDMLEDIYCFGPGRPLKVVHNKYGLLETNIVPGEEDVDSLVRLLAYRGGRSISLATPLLDTVILPTGDRASLTYRSEVSPSSGFTVRKFPRSPWTITRLIHANTLSAEAAAALWLALDARIPVLVYGQMRAGKTTLVNALLGLLPPGAVIGVVQDAPEIRSFHENTIYLYTSRSVGFEDLTRALLRRSVDYAIFGEIRVREEAYWWAQLVGTGHGGLSTIHASDPARIFARLGELGVGRTLMESVRVLVNVRLYTATVNGERRRVRRVSRISWVISPDGEVEEVYALDLGADELRRGKGLDELMEHAADTYGPEVYSEWERRREFLELAAGLGVYGAERFWNAHLRYRSDPQGTIEAMRRMARKRRRPVRAVELGDIRYCPRCGLELPPGSETCPRCGFRLVVLR